MNGNGPENNNQNISQPQSITGQVQYIYATVAEMTSGGSDVRIALGDMIPNNGVRPGVGIILPWPLAKKLNTMLANLIQEYEASQHRIVVPTLTH